MIKINRETPIIHDSINNIENRIKKFKETLEIVKTELTFLIDESIKKQRQYDQQYKYTLSAEELEHNKYENDLFVKENILKDLKDEIGNLERSIRDNKFKNKTLGKKIEENEKALKMKNENLKKWQEIINFSRSKQIFSKDKKNCQEIQTTSQVIGQKNGEPELHLAEVNLLDVDIQKNWAALSKNYHSKILEEENEIEHLKDEISNWKKEISENKITIKNQEKEIITNNQAQSQLDVQIKEIKAKIEKNVKEIRIKLNEIDNKRKDCFTENKLAINKKGTYIVNLFKEYKIFNEKINEDFIFLFTIKEQVNKFLSEYLFIKNSKYDNPISIMDDYDSELKTIIQNFTNFCGPNKYEEVLNGIKQFNNYKENNADEQLQSLISSEINNENHGKCKLFDFEQLELEVGSIIKIIPNYDHILQEYKCPYSYLIFIKDDRLAQKIAKNFYFNPLLSFEDCNEEEKNIFKKLQNKIAKKSKKNFVFNKNKSFSLLSISDNDLSQSLLFLIDFTTLIKITKKFIPLMYDYQKKYNLSKKISKKIANNFEKKNKQGYKFMFVNFRVQNNNIKNYIKNFDCIFKDISQQLNQLQQLNNLFLEFNKFLCLNKEKHHKEWSEYEKLQTNELVKEDDFVYKMVKEISNILDITITSNLVNLNYSIKSSNNEIQAIDIESINQESSSANLIFSQQGVLFNNAISY